MKYPVRSASTLFVLSALACTAAQATNGYLTHGYGIKAQGQAGVSIAQPQDALAAVNNPAGTTWLGNRFDAGMTLFAPDRKSEIRGNRWPLGQNANGKYDGNGREYFVIPEMGISYQINDQWAAGLAIFGNGGMNTGYKRNPFAAYGNHGSAGVDLSQLFILPSVAWKFADKHSVGVGLNLVYQRFAARGLDGFANPMFPFTVAHERMTNKGHDYSHGAGLRLGWQGNLTDNLTVGFAWSGKIKTTSFDDYEGLFAGHGSFDIPENYGFGLSWQATPKLRVGADYQEIRYSRILSVGQPFNVTSLMMGDRFGSNNGPGFGWKDVEVFKLGGSYEISPTLTVRAGFSHMDQPIPADQTFLNILAPGVIEDHASLGLTWNLGSAGELSLAYTHAFEKTVKGRNSIPTLFGGGEADLTMSQEILAVGYGLKF